MDWILVVLYMTDDRKLNQSIAENVAFKTQQECREHYTLYKIGIDKAVKRGITRYLPQGMGYTIEWQGCMVWNKEEEITQ